MKFLAIMSFRRLNICLFAVTVLFMLLLIYKKAGYSLSKETVNIHTPKLSKKTIENSSTSKLNTGKYVAVNDLMMSVSVNFDQDMNQINNTVRKTHHGDGFLNKCDAECLRFKALMSNWNKMPGSENKPKAAIYILAFRANSVKNVVKTIDIYFNNNYSYPIIVFHEATFVGHIDAIRNGTNSSIFFQQVDFELPSFIKSELMKDTGCPTRNIGYKHMCRFHVKGFFEQAITSELEFYWRLDDDSALMAPVKYDVFKFMKNKGLLYGYTLKTIDWRVCVKGLWPFTSKFIKGKKLNPTYFKNWPEPNMFYNNFEISSFTVWRSRGYLDYISYIDRLGGIYYIRWGDAPIKSLAVSLFVPMNEVHRFKDIGYKHKDYVQKGT